MTGRLRTSAVLLLLTASPLAARDTIPLDGGWQVRIDPADTAATKAHPREAKWFTAQVPGSVQQDLIRAKRVPDPFIGTNEGAIQWAGLSAWQFRKTLTVTRAMLAHRFTSPAADPFYTVAQVQLTEAVR
ncbi:hypothetical protein NF699_06615 [Sphingomonadaceae bacterium OTU29LAMAA1]|nr:hypothetical protein NF699_06615 [Sphingomonadaceae bacterium OTU29LAMAA1]